FLSKELFTACAISSSSAIVKLSLFIFPLKFCGDVPIRRASSATLISDRTHNTLICSEIVISGTSLTHQLLSYQYKSSRLYRQRNNSPFTSQGTCRKISRLIK